MLHIGSPHRPPHDTDSYIGKLAPWTVAIEQRKAMSIQVDFSCFRCGRALQTAWPMTAGLLWPLSYRWTCRRCEFGCRYMLFLKRPSLVYTVCLHDEKWRPVAGAKALPVRFAVTENNESGSRSDVSSSSRVELFLQHHAAGL